MSCSAEWLTSGPEPVEDLDLALEQLDEHGACVIAGALGTDLLADVRTALYRAAETDRRFGLAEDYQFGEDDHINQRIWNLPSHDPIFCELLEHPTAIEVVKRRLGWPASLSSMSANVTNGGGSSGQIHTDQIYLPGPLTRAWVYNLAWCIDEFRPENGATLILPGSHKFMGDELPTELAARMVPVVAPAGSLFVMDGRLWHTNGLNTCGTSRAAVFAVYTLPWLLPQENWSVSINPSIRQFASETLQTLFGFRPSLLGRINGRDRI